MHESNGIRQDPQSQFHKQTPTVWANSSPQFGMLQRGMTEKLHCTLFWSWCLPDHHWQLKMTTGQLGKQARFKETLASHWMGSVTWSSWTLLLKIMPEYFFFNIPADIWLQNSSSEITPELFFSQYSNWYLGSESIIWDHTRVIFSTFQLTSDFRIFHLNRQFSCINNPSVQY